MSNGNTVDLVGNCTGDPSLRYLQGSGMPVASFSMAVNYRRQNRQTQAWEDNPSFFEITAWGSLAENVSETVQKGTRVMVSGRLDQQTWQADDGSNRSKVVVQADEVGVALRWATAAVTRNPPKNQNDNGGYQQQPQQQQPARQQAQPARQQASQQSRGGGGGYGQGGQSTYQYDYDEEPF